jgi:hypothetical protein
MMTSRDRREPAARELDANDPYRHKGAVEGDRPGDEQYGNVNAYALDETDWPSEIAISEDVIGANVDESVG